ncbi:MAG TPA: SAM-dependent chlorinase/fluorinase, partial [Pyrinomonadaceae bacterium]
AAMKGVILGINRKAVIVDITHKIVPQAIASAAFVLRACYREFPPATVFCCVVDPGVGSERRAIIVSTNGQFFVGPDNGLFSFLYEKSCEITSIENDRYFRKPVSSTFHGRDIFAPVAAHLSLGVPPNEFGPQVTDPVRLIDQKAKRVDETTLKGAVVHIDHFGNIVTNVTADAAGGEFEIEVAGRTTTELREQYAGALPGQPFAIAGSSGLIEISINGGSAAEMLQMAVGAAVIVRLR